MAFKATPEQQKAIDRNGNILVSAAAGSGKTAVLVERVISRLCSTTNSISADRLLIVTFTNAAAAEMRSRIEKRLDEIISDNPDNVSLIIQKHLLSAAKICTIDSFCIDLVRENFEKLGIAPDFKMSDGASLESINNKVLSGIINRYLEAENPVFLDLLDIIGAEFDEGNFTEFVLNIYNYSRQLPFPSIWFDSISEPYTKEFDNSNIWSKYSFGKAQKAIISALSTLDRTKELLNVSEKAIKSYLPCFLELDDKLKALKEKCIQSDWDGFFQMLNDFKAPSLPIVRGISEIYRTGKG